MFFVASDGEFDPERLKKGKNVKKIYSNGLMVHTCLAVTTAGLPLGLLDQKIFSRKLRKKNTGKAKPHDHLPIVNFCQFQWRQVAVFSVQPAVEQQWVHLFAGLCP